MSADLMNRAEFARRAGVSVRKIDAMLREGEVSCVRLGGRVLFAEKHLIELAERFEQRASAHDSKRPIRIAR